jgi:hypothetical protein
MPTALPPLTSADVLMFLWILIGIMLVVVLYHVLFIVADVRKITKKTTLIVSQVESVVIKPLAIAEQALSAIMELFESSSKKKGKHASFDKKSVL